VIDVIDNTFDNYSCSNDMSRKYISSSETKKYEKTNSITTLKHSLVVEQ
jgi:hypothetical protein